MSDPSDQQQRQYDDVLNAIHAEEAYDPKSRAVIYVRLRDELNEELEALDPPLPVRDANNRRRALANAIRQLDQDFKDGKIELPETYVSPEELTARMKADQAGQKTADPDAATKRARQIYSDDELAKLNTATLDYTFTPPTMPRLLLQKLRVWRAMVVRGNRLQAVSDPFALIWMLIEPLFQIGVVVAIYALMQRALILDMPALPFAVIGVSGWLVFRVTFTRLMRDWGQDAPLVSFPVISPLDIYIARAITMAFLYGTGTVVLLAVIGWFDAFSPPQHIAKTIGLWLSLWAMGMGGGMLTGYLATFYPGIRRLAPLGLRVLFFFSGIMFVTEQLPEEFKPAFLWNPLTHGLQALRDAYFVEYVSTDASSAYVAFAASALVLAGLAGERVLRRKVRKP